MAKRHILDEFKEWQPKYAAYRDWTSMRARQVQAMKEMVCEASEVLELDVKSARKGKTIDREKVVDELGDVLWGLCGVMNEFGITFEEMVEVNIDKLTERNKK